MAEFYDYPPGQTDDALKNTQELYRYLIRLVDLLNANSGNVHQQDGEAQETENLRNAELARELDKTKNQVERNKQSIMAHGVQIKELYEIVGGTST